MGLRARQPRALWLRCRGSAQQQNTNANTNTKYTCDTGSKQQGSSTARKQARPPVATSRVVRAPHQAHGQQEALMRLVHKRLGLVHGCACARHAECGSARTPKKRAPRTPESHWCAGVASLSVTRRDGLGAEASRGVRATHLGCKGYSKPVRGLHRVSVRLQFCVNLVQGTIQTVSVPFAFASSWDELGAMISSVLFSLRGQGTFTAPPSGRKDQSRYHARRGSGRSPGQQYSSSSFC
jgi:hypothetical protein